MTILLDVGVLIAGERGAIARTWIDGLDDEPALSTVTVAEALHGVERAAPEARRNRRAAYYEGLFAGSLIVPVDEEIARETARVSADLARRGETISAFDTVIAATALVRGWPLAAIDRHFERVPGLRLLLPPG